MMNRVTFPRRFLILALLLISATGCAGTEPSKFYVLSSMHEPSKATQVTGSRSHMIVGIGPVELAGYLDRPQIVTPTSANQLELADFDKWAEPLKDNFSRVLVENLSGLLFGDAIAVFPWRVSTPLDVRIELEVTHLDGNPGGNALLAVRWTIFAEEGRKMLLTKRSTFKEPVGGPDYEALISAHSRNIAALSREIAEEIRTLRR